MPTSAAALDDADPEVAYAGVFRTNDGGDTWWPYRDGLPQSPVVELRFNCKVPPTVRGHDGARRSHPGRLGVQPQRSACDVPANPLRWFWPFAIRRTIPPKARDVGRAPFFAGNVAVVFQRLSVKQYYCYKFRERLLAGALPPPVVFTTDFSAAIRAAFNRWHLRVFRSDLSTGRRPTGSRIVL